MRALVLALFVLAGCASDYEFEQTPFAGSTGTVANPSNEWAQWHYDCALKRMQLDAPGPGPVPEIRWVDKRWRTYYGEVASGAYLSDTNTVLVTHSRISTEVVVHEMVHAIQFQRGEAYSEWEAYRASSLWKHCLIFGVK